MLIQILNYTLTPIREKANIANLTEFDAFSLGLWTLR